MATVVYMVLRVLSSVCGKTALKTERKMNSTWKFKPLDFKNTHFGNNRVTEEF